jgi:hypothetical protein
MHKTLKFYRSKLALAIALLIFVSVLPAAAQEREKQKESPALRSATFAVTVPPTSIPLPKSSPTLFPEITTGATSTPPQGGSSKSDNWQFQFTPYVWFPSVDGKLNVAGRDVPFDASFRDIFDNLNFAFMTAVEARKGRWGIGADLMYINLDSQNTYAAPSAFSSSKVSNKMFMLGPEVFFRVAENEKASMDVLAGFRYWHNTLDFDLTAGILPGTGQSRPRNWVDPLVGTRIKLHSASGWSLTLNGDVGGFGAGSDFAWQTYGGIGKDFKKRFTFLFGYRALGLQFDDSDALRRFTFYGPIMGVAIKFPAK